MTSSADDDWYEEELPNGAVTPAPCSTSDSAHRDGSRFVGDQASPKSVNFRRDDGHDSLLSPRLPDVLKDTGGVVVICTALELEYSAVRHHLVGPGESLDEKVERGSLYEIGTFRGAHGTWTVVLTQTGVGNIPAGVDLERAISVFSPEVVLFVGVAGGRQCVELGDVVAADAIYDYESGRDTDDGYLPRIKTHRATHHMVQRARSVNRRDQWQKRIQPGCPEPPPRVFVKPLAAGSKVVSGGQSETAQFLDKYCDDTFAVEMEGMGFLQGAYVNSGVDALVVRGISDALSGKTQEADRYWQPRAAAHAAAFAFGLLDSFGPRDCRHPNSVPLLVKKFHATLDSEVSCRIIWVLRGLGTDEARDALRTLKPRHRIERLMIRDALEDWPEQPPQEGNEPREK